MVIVHNERYLPLGISHRYILTVDLKRKVSELDLPETDRRGKHKNRLKRVPEAVKESAREHIRSLYNIYIDPKIYI